MSHHEQITDELIDRIVASTYAHERSVYRRLLGLPVRGRVAGRVDAELQELGLLPSSQGLADTQEAAP